MIEGDYYLSSREGFGPFAGRPARTNTGLAAVQQRRTKVSLTPDRWLLCSPRRDRWHEWAKGVFFSLGKQLWTSELVIGEVAWNLGQNSAATAELLSFIHQGELGVILVLEQHAARLSQLMAKYERMDVCDGSLVVLSEQYPKAKIITVDARVDFLLPTGGWLDRH